MASKGEKQGSKTITPGKVGMQANMIPIDETYFDFDRNVRMASRYSTDPIPNFDPTKHRAGLYESIDAEGVKVPLTVALLSEADQAELQKRLGWKPTYRGIAGHRRFKVLSEIHKKDPTRFVTIPALVYTGLTSMDEIRLMMDHEHIAALNDFERYLSIKRLLLTGMSEEAVGVQVGVSRGYVQRRKWIMTLPPYVEDNFRMKFETPKEGEEPNFVKFTDKDLITLAESANADRKAGLDPDADGSAFKAAWTKLVESGRAAPKEIKSLTRDQILQKSALVHDPLLKGVMLVCAGDDVNLLEIIESQKALRDAAAAQSKSNQSNQSTQAG